MKIKKIILVILLCLMALPGLCSTLNVTARVDKYKISLEDSIFLTIEVNGGKADLDLSGIKDFKVLSRGTSTSFNYINGKSQRKASYQYVLMPLSRGTLKIPALKATRKDQTAFTKQIIIHVADQIVDPHEIKALFSKAFMAKNQIFVGEQTIFTLQFFTSKRLSGLGFETPPGFNGLSAKPFDKEKSFTQNINGVLYNVTQVDYIITSSNPGLITIDPAVLIAKVTMRSNMNDSFFFSDRSKPVRVISNPVEIKVLPLPQYQTTFQTLGDGKFSGLVGNFDIQSNIDKTTLKAGESATLTIKISGTGNIMDAIGPEMDFNEDEFKVYDDNPVETIKLTQQGYTGFKTFKKAIVPVNPGKYEIKPVSLIYFDVDKKVYTSVSTEPISLDVKPSEQMHLALQPQDKEKRQSIIKKEVALVNKDILEIKEGFKVLKKYKEINLGFFVLFLSIPAILFFGVKIFTMALKREMSMEKIMQERAKSHFKKAIKLNKDGHDFLSNLYSSLVSSILAKKGKKGETITIKEAKTILTDAGVDNENINQITTLLEHIESVRFGGKILDENMAKELLVKTKQIIKIFSIVFVCLGVFTFAPHKAMADSTAVFIDAIKDYKTGNFQQAALKFESIAKNNVQNPYLYYNIGNSYLKARKTGHAILWYERAKILAPNDPDLNFNLAYAHGLVKDKKEDSVKIMEILFFWDNLIPVKIIQIMAVGFSLLFFMWASIQAIRQQRIFSGFGIILFSLFTITTAIVFVNYYKQTARLNAVIVGKEAVIRSGMADTSTKLFTLHAGTKIRVVEQRDGYLKIRFSNDKIGWVKTGHAIII
ncbi:MAG: hypothetical protein GY857_05735 [Desulfobacula sp.]|nr:hypothetical protein [Desulfobacula sp.]